MVNIIICVLGDIQFLKIKPQYVNVKLVTRNSSSGYSKCACIGLDLPVDVCKWMMYIRNPWPKCELVTKLWETKMLNVILWSQPSQLRGFVVRSAKVGSLCSCTIGKRKINWCAWKIRNMEALFTFRFIVAAQYVVGLVWESGGNSCPLWLMAKMKSCITFWSLGRLSKKRRGETCKFSSCCWWSL